MALFTDEDLQGFSDLATDLALKDEATIRRYAKVDDGMGGYTQTWVDVTPTVLCMVSDSGQAPSEQFSGDAYAGRLIKRIDFPRGTDIRDGDRVVVENITYRVIEPLDPTSYEVLRRVYCERLKVV